MKTVTFVFNTPNLVNRGFKLSDSDLGELLRSWIAMLPILFVGSKNDLRYGDGDYYIRSDLVAYIKVSEGGEE